MTNHHRNPLSLLTPTMHKVLERMHRVQKIPMHAMTPQQARQAYAGAADVLEIPAQARDRVEDFTVMARDGFAIPVRLYAPTGSNLPVLVYFHGGGFTIGSIATHDVLCRRLSCLAHCAVLSVDYRLAPEHKFPTAQDDAWDVLRWASTAGAERGLDSSRIAVGGDSAGGTLAAVCAIQARDEQVPLVLQLLFYPGTAGHQDTPSHQRFAKGFVLEEPHITYFFELYIRGPQDRDDWRFAPLDGRTPDGYEADLSGVAPAWLGLAECDPLVDEGVAYADRLRMAGVPVDMEIYKGVVHEFIKMGRALPEAAQAHADAARALRSAFGL
ncbi:alpha/beta hydrolase [Rhodoferax sp. GW822-FHT02A01]|jgi:acetyl esterase|uniref:alpha/beta hydrolase n=1 Tax=Rhodoferax sp. GW822-FHT02A01 TaxID=3141537 RepID=UPI00315D60A7